jgi:TonB family protein
MISAMSAEAIRREWAGRVIDGRFTLLQWLGGTERSGVFLTELPGPQAQKAAIKLIAADGGDAEARIAGWAATSTLSHPHLIRLLDTGRCQIDDAALVYAVMEYADEVLAEILPERPLTPGETKEMLGPVLDTLSYLHGKGFVHGHVKPSNIMVVDDQLKLAGDSLWIEGETWMNGAPAGVYDAPEAATGTISPAGDVWSLGVTLVVALTQHPPVWDGSMESDPVVPESIPQPLAGIARGCLKIDPAHRCTLEEIRAQLDAASSPPAAPEKAGGRVPGKSRTGVVVAGVLVLLAVIAVFLVRSHQVQSSSPDGEQAPAATTAPPQTQEQAPTATTAPPQAQEQAPTAATAPPEEQTPAGTAASPQEPAPAATTEAPVAGDQNSRGPASNGTALKGAVADQVLPDVPASASRTIHGKVNVGIRVTVDAGGTVSDAAFDSEGPSKYFAKAAMQAAQRWKFKPAQVDGQTVSSVWMLRFQFAQDGTTVTPVETSP